ncbi:MAG: alpha/beta fold hydrolase, partial [bacterium]
MRQHSDTGFLSVPGAQLYYEVAGAGDSLVFIHAGVADSRMWDEQFAVFSQRHRVVRYDTRGFGRSKTEDVEFSNHEDLRDLLDHLEIEKASLVGASRAGG